MTFVYSFVLCFVQSEFFTTDKLNAKLSRKLAGIVFCPGLAKTFYQFFIILRRNK